MSSNMSESPIQLLVGLGNPGPEHERTRHNVGWWLVDEVARRWGGQFKSERKFHGDLARVSIGGHVMWLLKPGIYMNRSGLSVRAFADYKKIAPEHTLVAHDDLDLPVGVLRLKESGGHGGHNGLRDLIAHMGRDFRRLRIGIGHPGKGRDVVAYVLKRPPAEETESLMRAIDDGADAVENLLEVGLQRAMTRLHSDDVE